MASPCTRPRSGCGPWLVQMGYGRGGWYTPEWADLFANRVFGIRHPFPASAGRLLPEYQHVAVGDLICDGPDYASYFRVLRVDPQHALVYRSIRHPRRGSPIDITDPASRVRLGQPGRPRSASAATRRPPPPRP